MASRSVQVHLLNNTNSVLILKNSFSFQWRMEPE